MKKGIIKELIIILLLTVVIVLTLRMVIYDFIPDKSSIPSSIKYTKDSIVEKVLEEINIEKDSSINSNNSLLKSYTIEESDLKEYVLKKEYKNGKIDPFTQYVKP